VEKLYTEAVSVLDTGTAKGRLHKNTAARKKSSITKPLNKVTAEK
jgi:ribosomal protein S20